jgi:para-nitrobenzyl esterase
MAGEINGPTMLSLGGPPATPRVGWGPTLDGKVIDVRSFADVAPEVSRNVPMLNGNTSEEGMH